MVTFFRASQISQNADLASQMFRDRAAQFRDRMSWDVTVDDLGWETDEYDSLDPVYIVVHDAEGGHAGSMRLLPTTGRTMLAEVFPHLLDHEPARDAGIWECTRFCLSPSAGAGVAQMMLLAAFEAGSGHGVRQAYGVFDTPMIRVYRRLGWTPEVLGRENGISAGIWTFTPDVHERLCRDTGIEPRKLRRIFEEALGELALPAAA